MNLVAAVGGQHIATSIGAAEATNAPEILSEAGPKGLHVAEIAKKADTDASKLGRILRLLSTVHIFQEVAPDVFANNRISSILASGKTLEEIRKDGMINKHNKLHVAHMILRYWQREYPEALADGRVKLQTHDFFTPQPVKNAAVFFLRYILHDWPTEKAKLILKALRLSATPDTRLILLENIVPYAVAGLEQNTPGDKVPVPPAPLLPNCGELVVQVGCTLDDAVSERPGAYAGRVDYSDRWNGVATGGYQA